MFAVIRLCAMRRGALFTAGARAEQARRPDLLRQATLLRISEQLYRTFR